MQQTLAKSRINNVFQESLGNIRKGKRANIGKTMIKHGYSITSADTVSITKTKTWQELLDAIDDNAILSKVKQTALDTKDKRAHLQAADMIFKLKDKYPAGKLKVTSYNEELERIKVSN